jgi:hypothetical protein
VGESHFAALMTGTMARPWPEGNRRRGFFPRLLQGLSQYSTRRMPGPITTAIPGYKEGVQQIAKTEKPRRMGSGVRRNDTNQLLSSDLIRLSNSSNEASPLIFSPLMKKVGVELTFSTSLAYF